MATPASVRLPWRVIIRSATANPAAHLFRAQCAVNTPMQAFARRHTSKSASTHPPAANATSTQPTPETESSESQPDIRLPRAVQAVYLRPLRREAQRGVPSCDLQMRSYSVRNLEFFADFALRAAYYLGLPAYGPVPLPRIVERWTVPRSSFIFKKSQENFERRTVRRLIQIRDGHPETVEVWLAFLRKHAYYGIGMKANIYEFSKLGVGKTMDVNMQKMEKELEIAFGHFGLKKGDAVKEKVLEMINREDFRAATSGNAPMVKPPP